MKKIITGILVLALFIAGIAMGWTMGIRHVLGDMEIYTVDRYDPENPEESAWNGYDQLVFIDLDGQVYEHGMYQG